MPDAAQCAGQVVNCNLCHTTTAPAGWNPFGLAVMGEMAKGPLDVESFSDRAEYFDAALPAALQALMEVDSDQDGLSNGEELRLGTQPGNAESFWVQRPDANADANDFYAVGQYDPAFAFRRVFTLYCGQSPTYEEQQAFSALSDVAAMERLHGAVETCLQSDYWTQVALRQLAHKRVRPLKVAGPETNATYGPLRAVIGDYEYDYRLWRYALTGDRDMRDLLVAQYHVEEETPGVLQRVEGIVPKKDQTVLMGGQPLDPSRRAGMLTTQWFLAMNTMFSDLPRTTAAQAYRAYLGADIARNEGLRPVPGEPADVDHKGVYAPACATCHATLDPLSYAFAPYEGIPNNPEVLFGTYSQARPAERIPDWSDEAQHPVVLGQQVADLVEWARVAADSDDFKRNMASVFFEHALNRGPLPGEQGEFQSLWQALPDDGYSATKLIHRLVDTMAFGEP